MTTTTQGANVTTLTEFLTARLDEDEAVARAAVGSDWIYDLAEAPADPEGGNRIAMIRTDVSPDGDAWRTVAAGWSPDAPSGDELGASLRPEEGEHIARHDPARVLAEVEAKRRIVEECKFFEESMADYRPDGVVSFEQGMVQHLALPYADHPDYDEAWRP